MWAGSAAPHREEGGDWEKRGGWSRRIMGAARLGKRACLGRFLRYRPLSLGSFFTVVVLKVPMAGAKVWRLPERRRGRDARACVIKCVDREAA